MSTITVTRETACSNWDHGSEEIEVEVTCRRYPGEAESRDCPGSAPWCEFESATVDGMDFELTDEEIDKAETACYNDAMDDC
jgi:predicted hydrocarbon binding protein